MRAELERRSEIPNVSTRTDSAGRRQPARKTTPKTTPKPPVKSVPARDDIGLDGAGEITRKDARIEELQAEKHQLELKNIGLRSEVEELKAATPTAEALARITLTQFLALMPPAWLPQLTARVAGHLSAAELVDALENRLQRDGINVSAQLQKIRTRIEQCRPEIDLKAMPAVAGMEH